VNLFQQQESNRRKSWMLVGGFLLFFAWLGLGGDYIARELTAGAPPEAYHHRFPWFGLALFAIAIGLVANIRRSGAKKVLWSTGARELLEPSTPEERQLMNVVEEMAVASGVAPPRVYLVDDPDPNAFVTGTDPIRNHLAVTTGLLAMLDRDELQGVVAHELGHVKNLDTQLMTLVAGIAGAIALIADGSGRLLRHGARLGGGSGGRSGRGGGKGGNPLLAVVIVLWIVSWLLAPLVTRLMAMGISRKREYLADAMAAQFTRNPAALASALQKIDRAGAPTRAIKGGVAHLCIADPLERKISNKQGFLADLLATHPPMAIRVARLKAMGYQAQKAAGDFSMQ
jgi:heat shock protein HtpX